MSRSALLGGSFLALLLWLSLSLTALAAVRQISASSQQPPEDVTRAGVSVVRLLVSYVDAKAAPTAPAVAQCSGLGVIVASWSPLAASTNTGSKNQGNNNWILTDGSLISSDQETPSCVSTHPGAKLSAIQIYASSAYKLQPIPLTLTETIPVKCSTTPCNKGVALFSVSTEPNDTRPFLDLATQDTTQTAGIALGQQGGAAGVLPTVVASAQDIDAFGQQVVEFLTPTEQLLTTQPKLEAGTPLVNSQGQLTGLHVSAGTSPNVAALQAFLKQNLPQSRGPNLVHDNWDKGVDAFYQKNMSVAHSAFVAASAANPQFQAARDFAAQTQQNPPASTGQSSKQPTSAPPQGPLTINGVTISYKVLLIVLGIVILVAALLVTSLLFGRARSQRAQRQKALKAELAEAERRAAVDAQRIAEQEAAQRDVWAQQPTLPPPTPVQASTPSGPLGRPELPCPNCGKMVPRDANFCPNCRLLLSPSESGLHLRVFPQVLGAPPTPQVSQMSPVLPASMPPIPPALPVPSSPAPVVPAGSLSEQPTIEIAPATATVGSAKNGKTDAEKTLPYGNVTKPKGRRLGFLAGTRSDPGIKRKYKPNEDSLFAAQGMLNGSPTPRQFGLFVVADGMGGHANGQDASRLAIQTIIDFLLPRLKTGGNLSDIAFEQLLAEGVQTANQAVHQHNMDQRADMGTTMTGTLIVDTTAFVANVGDSRTYLYREGEGLRKITNDHSVVASLVEAGIIKPDDIYTHPKRNQIYRSLGEKPAVEVDSFAVPLQMGDKLLLCSDGLWDMVRDPKIEEVIKTPVNDPGVTGNALIQAALDGGGEDNVSVIVVNVTEASKATRNPRFQLLAKPETVQMPKL